MARQTNWFSMTALFFWKENAGRLPRYEKRVTICAAENAEAATEMLLAEAKAYAVSPIRFMGTFEIQEMDPPSRRHPVEVAHELTLAVDPAGGERIKPAEFRRKFRAADRLDNCEDAGLAHAWHNIDGQWSGCSNCRVKRRSRR